ncbi:MAG: hypothetical protein KDD19_06390, partial [Phaeodactylibacter sp.]|nr:hypothetical protein [Phaeodactylibacter sp.]
LCPRLTSTIASLPAVPQAGMGNPLCSTMWWLKISGSFTCGKATTGNVIPIMKQQKKRKIGRNMGKLLVKVKKEGILDPLNKTNMYET